jgi:hypothetical protein
MIIGLTSTKLPLGIIDYGSMGLRDYVRQQKTDPLYVGVIELGTYPQDHSDDDQ